MSRLLKYILLLLLLPKFLMGIERPVVKSIHFEANHAFSDGKLRSLMGIKECVLYKKHYLYRDLLIRDLKTIIDFYYRCGYMDAKVQDFVIKWSSDSSAVDIMITLNEGNPVVVDTIEISGVNAIPLKSVRKRVCFKANEVLNFDEIATSEQAMMKYYGNKGFLAASVSRNIIRKGDKAIVQFNIDEARKYYLGYLLFKGNEQTKNWILEQDLKTKPGEVLTLKEIESLRAKLFKYGIFQVINISTKPTDVDSIRDLLVEVIEKDAGEFSFGGGYSSEEGPRLNTQFGYINLFRRGVGVGIEWRISTIKRLVKVQYYEPHFLQTRFFLNSSVSWSFNVERYFNSERFEAQSNLGYYISDLYLIKLGYNFYKTALSNVSVDLLPGEEDNFSNQLIAELTYDTRDSKIYSRKGMFIRINGSISEPFSLEGMDFAKLELSIRKFIPVKNLAVWALQAKSGNIFTLQANYIPLEERFFLGGVTTVRGYPRNSLGPETTSGIPVGGNYYYLLRSGLRFHIWNWVGGKILMDNGGLYNNISSAMWRDNYTGTGLGIQIGWGIWGAQLEYTWKIEETVKPGMWYFEIGQTF